MTGCSSRLDEPLRERRHRRPDDQVRSRARDRFSPQHQNAEQAKEAILHVVGRDPRLLGTEDTRWSLDSIKRACDFLGSISQGGLCQLLGRLEISWKRFREHVRSPDPDYEAKLDVILCLRDEVRVSYGRQVLLHQDEVTIYRRPTPANAWEERGLYQALAERSHQSNTPTTVVATLDLVGGQVIYRRP